jgi:hypothetical protein
LEDEFFDGANVLKKKTALPMFHMGEQKSIYICKDGMCWVLKQIQKEITADDDGWETMDKDESKDADPGDMLVDATASNASRMREWIMNYHGNEDMYIFTYKKWLIHVFDIGKNENFKGFPHPPTTAENFDEHWGGVKVTTDGVSASLIFVKRNQAVSETMRHVDDDNDDVKMKKKESDAESKPLVKTRPMDKLLLPLPPWSEYTILPLSFILFLFNLAGSH